MKITIEPDLATSAEYFFAFPHKNFKNQSQPTAFFKIPLQQRDYDWGDPDLTDKDDNNIEGLLEDLDYHIVFGANNYFAGTVLLENQSSDFLKIIDGQQRTTTLFLLNFLAYLISRFRLEHMPTYPNQIEYALQFKDRFDSFMKFEKRIFLSNLSDDINSLINVTGSSDSNQELIKRLGRSSNAEQEYWSRVILRLQFDDLDINASFVDTVKKANILVQNEILEIKKISKSKYYNGLNIIFTYLLEHNPRGPISVDSYLLDLQKCIEKYTSICGLAAIISEDSDDSFRLFEILNDRGQDLSALDLVKNIILEKCHQKSISIPQFPRDWKKLKENVRNTFTKGKADSIFIEHVIRSEGSTLKSKEISYLNNKLPDERDLLFKNETVLHFFKRLYHSAQLLKEINDNLKNNTTNNSSPFNRSPMSCFQYATFMKMINYNWGPQILLASNIQYLVSSNYERSLFSGTYPDWKNSTSNRDVTDLNHFTRFLGDVVLKLGILGVVLGLATKDLPTASKEICRLIITNVRNNPNNFNTQANLTHLKNQILGYLATNIFTASNINSFESTLSDTFIASTGQKRNLVRVLLYFCYNKGGQVHSFNFPELEHLEPSRYLVGASPYYMGMDREVIINRLGNFALIEKEINNVDFNNKPLLEKLRLIFNDPDLTSQALFQSDLFLNLNYENCKTESTIFGVMPRIKMAEGELQDDDSFDLSGAPTTYFFNTRSRFLAKLSREIVCNIDTFLDGNSKY